MSFRERTTTTPRPLLPLILSVPLFLLYLNYRPVDETLLGPRTPSIRPSDYCATVNTALTPRSDLSNAAVLFVLNIILLILPKFRLVDLRKKTLILDISIKISKSLIE